jgi:hypothetical protein
MSGKNTQAYYKHSEIMDVKSFIKLAPEVGARPVVSREQAVAG